MASLKRGSKGSKVADLQRQLVAAGYTVDVDGDFGNQTRNAVMQFQRDNGLSVDGKAGNATMGALIPKPRPKPSAESEGLILPSPSPAFMPLPDPSTGTTLNSMPGRAPEFMYGIRDMPTPAAPPEDMYIPADKDPVHFAPEGAFSKYVNDYIRSRMKDSDVNAYIEGEDSIFNTGAMPPPSITDGANSIFADPRVKKYRPR